MNQTDRRRSFAASNQCPQCGGILDATPAGLACSFGCGPLERTAAAQPVRDAFPQTTTATPLAADASPLLRPHNYDYGTGKVEFHPPAAAPDRKKEDKKGK